MNFLGLKFCWYRSLALLCLWCCLGLSGQGSVIAAVHTYSESPTQTMHRSQQSLRDDRDQAWQAVLFKRIKQGEVDLLHLRLIGFPGQAALVHPQALQLSTGDGEVLIAPDVSDQAPSLANVGEYDFLVVVPRLKQSPPLRLSLPVEGGRVMNLLVPPFVVREWHQVFEAR